MENLPTPSRHQPGDPVILNFFSSGTLFDGVIAACKFTDYGKVLYDIHLYPFKHEPENVDIKTTICNIDSYFVTEAPGKAQ